MGIENNAKGTPKPSPPDIWDEIKVWIFRRFGIKGLVTLALVSLPLLLWWNWGTVRNVPGIPWLINWIAEKPIPKANLEQFSVALGHLENDTNGEYQRLITNALREWRGVEILKFDRKISLTGSRPEEAKRLGHQKAQGYLAQSGAQVMIWGEVLFPKKENSKTHLFWTVSGTSQKDPISHSYKPTSEIELPPLFWDDLYRILGLVVFVHTREFEKRRGDFLAERLDDFISGVRNLLQSDMHQLDWDPEFRATLWLTLGNSLRIYGEERNDSKSVVEAVSSYDMALNYYNKFRQSDQQILRLNWAVSKMGLGNALTRRAFYEEGKDRRLSLQSAIDAYKQSQNEFTFHQWPLDWALISTNMAGAFTELAIEPEQCSEMYLKMAITIAQEAAEVLKKVGDRLDQARVILTIGNAEISLGECNSDLQQMEKSITTFEQAVVQIPQEQAPMDWAWAQNSLATALASLGRRELTDDQKHGNGVAHLKRADEVFELALEEWTTEGTRSHRARVQLNRARTLLNLAIGLLSPEVSKLGKAQLRKVVQEAEKYLQKAEKACREASRIFDHESMPPDSASVCAEVSELILQYQNYLTKMGN